MAFRVTIRSVLAGTAVLLSALTVSTTSNASTISDRCHTGNGALRSSCCYYAESVSLWQRIFGSTCISKGDEGHGNSIASAAGTKSNSAPSSKSSSSNSTSSTGGSTGGGSGGTGGTGNGNAGGSGTGNGGGNNGAGGGNNGGGTGNGAGGSSSGGNN
ncbi:hypothetical protein [Labrys neptuniae]